MKTTFKYVIGTFIALLFLVNSSVAQDYNSCIVKAKSEWGSKCPKCVIYDGYKRVWDDTYKVYLQNTCEEKIDAMCCVQEEDKTWRCSPVTPLNPNDTLIEYACKGTGKYLYWTRKAGDTSIQFPSNTDVNEDYKE